MKSALCTVAILTALLGNSLSFAEEAASTDLLQYHPASLRFGIGSTVGPESLLILLSAEGHLDRFFSFGPMLQFGVDMDRTVSKDMVAATVGGRFTFPVYGLPSKMEIFEISVQSGAGWLYRTVDEFGFNHFVFETGMDIDAHLTQHVTAGIGAIFNITSSGVERLINSVYASVTYRL